MTEVANRTLLCSLKESHRGSGNLYHPVGLEGSCNAAVALGGGCVDGEQSPRHSSGKWRVGPGKWKQDLAAAEPTQRPSCLSVRRRETPAGRQGSS